MQINFQLLLPGNLCSNGDLKLLYHGRIDDKRRLEEVTSNDLQKALDEILAGKPVSVSSTKLLVAL
ncbi:MAG: hypothetical protein IPG53_20445 [Ignavibacteriales bacterium]|nr:hypothetical protein [Ignavibacteriales bacterium]